ncbi:MAG: ATP-binding cassette domain-containing protein [Agriterribacter sp.]
MTDMLSISGITHRFETKLVLNNVSFEMHSGDIIGIFGSNGSGKSTLLNLLFGTLRRQGGTININNHKIAPVELRKHIAYSTQNVFLPASLTVRNIIPLYFPESDDQNRIFYSEGIHKIEKYKVGRLSIGEQKYLQFLLTVHLPQQFILLDEPFAMIDPLYQDIIRNKILELSAVKGFILTDHYYKQVFEIANKRFLMKEGILNPITSIKDLKDGGYISGG